MFISPFDRTAAQDSGTPTRLGEKEAARQAALLRHPGPALPQDSTSTSEPAREIHASLRREAAPARR